ncbi:MAG: TetR/AcrR family transcriptional regulator [Pseudomonadota bacterium]
MSDIDSFEALQRAQSTREQILNAAMLCIIRLGPARTNISSIATQAGLSRPTVYAHFENLDELVLEAIQKGTSLLCASIANSAQNHNTQEERIIAAFDHTLQLAGKVNVLRTPMSFAIAENGRDVIPSEGIEAAKRVLADLLDDTPDSEEAANEQAETAVRFFLSLAAFRRPEGTEDDLAGYIKRVVLPALGLRS